MTNLEKIKSLSIDEMTLFLARFELGDIDYGMTFCDMCKGFPDGTSIDCYDDCLKTWLTRKADSFDYEEH